MGPATPFSVVSHVPHCNTIHSISSVSQHYVVTEYAHSSVGCFGGQFSILEVDLPVLNPSCVNVVNFLIDFYDSSRFHLWGHLDVASLCQLENDLSTEWYDSLDLFNIPVLCFSFFVLTLLLYSISIPIRFAAHLPLVWKHSVAIKSLLDYYFFEGYLFNDFPLSKYFCTLKPEVCPESASASLLSMGGFWL